MLKAGWPKFDPSLLVEELTTIVIQVNGKLRSKIEVPRNTSDDKLKQLILADPKLSPWIQGKPIKNFIIVPNKLVNLLV